jgi:lipopolysaccharide/colanic/teichoic acid biosynthesis glycosyltransferase
MPTYHQSLAKRLLDIFFSLLILPLAIPAICCCLLLILATSGSPLFFVQTRVGRNEKHFQLIKLRSLKNKFDAAPGALHGPDDITFIGRLMRSSRIDELPQIWNILKGEMSWVGPRPEVPYHYEHFKQRDANYATRQSVKPGITGLAQLNNPDALPNENLEKLKLDLEYVNQANIWMDLRILAQTFLLTWTR